MDVATNLGSFLADGWLSGRNNQVCTARDGNLNAFGIAMKPYERGNWSYVYSKRLAITLSLLGLKQPHNSARLPKWLYHLPKDRMIAFIREFISKDGWKTKGFSEQKDAYRMELASEWLVRDFKTLCDYVGLFSGKVIHRRRLSKPPNSKKPRIWDTWQLYIRFDKEPAKMTGVVSVKPIGKEHVFDLSVPPFSNFIANGIIVHNSMATQHVAGIVGLLYDRGKVRTVEDIKRIMKEKGHSKDIETGYGLLKYTFF